MSRYNPSAMPDTEVSQEGIGSVLSGIGGFIVNAAKAISKGNALAAVVYDRGCMPEINGRPYRSYGVFIADLKKAIQSGELFDANFHIAETERVSSVDSDESVTTLYCGYFYGTGTDIVPRIPLYSQEAPVVLSVLHYMLTDAGAMKG